MTALQRQIREYVASALPRIPDGWQDRAWWMAGTLLADDLAAMGMVRDEARDCDVFMGLPVEWVEGDQMVLKLPTEALAALEAEARSEVLLAAVPVAFAWTCPKRGRMMASAVRDQPALPLRQVLRLLSRPTIGEARRVFGRAFKEGLGDAVRAMQ